MAEFNIDIHEYSDDKTRERYMDLLQRVSNETGVDAMRVEIMPKDGGLTFIATAKTIVSEQLLAQYVGSYVYQIMTKNWDNELRAQILEAYAAHFSSDGFYPGPWVKWRTSRLCAYEGRRKVDPCGRAARLLSHHAKLIREMKR